MIAAPSKDKAKKPTDQARPRNADKPTKITVTLTTLSNRCHLGLWSSNMSKQNIAHRKDIHHDRNFKPKRIGVPHSRVLRLQPIHKAARLTEKRAFFAGLSLFLITFTAFNFLLVPHSDCTHKRLSLKFSKSDSENRFQNKSRIFLELGFVKPENRSDAKSFALLFRLQDVNRFGARAS